MEAASASSRPLPGDRLRGSGYGLVLLLILASLVFQLAASDSEAARVVAIVLQSATLLAAFHVSGVPTWLFHLAGAAALVACLSVTGVALSSGELGEAAGRSVGLALVLGAPVAIVMGTIRHFRAARGVTLTTMFAVLCIYLLLGMAFAYLYGIGAEIEHGQFFTNAGQAEDQSNFLYFSFTTITTTGYGDFTARTDLGHSLAITEALIGQIYLVTLVALIVGNMGRGPLRR